MASPSSNLNPISLFPLSDHLNPYLDWLQRGPFSKIPNPGDPSVASRATRVPNTTNPILTTDPRGSDIWDGDFLAFLLRGASAHSEALPGAADALSSNPQQLMALTPLSDDPTEQTAHDR